ncbi:MAG: hypothetical protein AAF693_12870 [Bacteroidota bacterium]
MKIPEPITILPTETEDTFNHGKTILKALVRNIALLCLVASCAPSIYVVTTDTTIKRVQNQRVKKKIIYLNGDMGSIADLDQLAKNINDKIWGQVEKNIQSFSAADQAFFRGVKYLIQEKYETSYHLLTSIDKSLYDCQVAVLQTDCLYELKADSVDFKKRYQEAMNCARHELTRQLIKTRYRFLRYDQ